MKSNISEDDVNDNLIQEQNNNSKSVLKIFKMFENDLS